MKNNNVRMVAISGEDLIDLFKQLQSDISEELDSTYSCDECQYTDESEYIEPGDADYNKSEHIVSLIEDITINTLSAPKTVSLESAQTLSILADLHMYYTDAK